MTKALRVNFEALKARADFRSVLAHYGLTPVGHGDQAKIHCPFHEDERPSCSVNLEKGLFHCFAGGCQAQGNVLDFVHRMEAQNGTTPSIREAGLTLARICGLEADHGKAAGRRQEPRRATQGAGTTQEPARAINDAPGASGEPRKDAEDQTRPPRNKPLGFRLTLDPDHPYLAKRGVAVELAALFGLGHCAHGSMAGRLCIPIHNAKGELVAYAGRWTGAEAELPAGEEKYKLPKGFQKGLELWNLHRVKHCRHLVVVEGYFGAIRLHGLRLPAVALMGSSLSEEQMTLLTEHCPTLRYLSVLLDGDDPGRKAAEPVAARLSEHWWVRTIRLADGAQPDSLADGELERRLGRAQR